MRHRDVPISESMTSPPANDGDARPKAHILTVSVEEYFHTGALVGTVRRKHWDRFESRVERSIEDVLALLGHYDQCATFFVLGCIADRHPALIARVAAAGHEVAASGYWPQVLSDTLRDAFREDLKRSRDAIETATGKRVLGFRAPHKWLTGHDLWVLEVLAEEGFAYDSSINPSLHRFDGPASLRDISWHAHSAGRGGVWEVPITTIGVSGWRMAVSGGNYARQLPHSVLSRIVAHLDRTRAQPLVFYFMPWELDRGQPQVTSVSRLTRIRQYRNLGKARWVFEDYCTRYRFQTVAHHLELPEVAVSPAVAAPIAVATVDTRLQQAVSLVIPLYNEELNVAYLHRTLTDLRHRLAARYRVHVVLVDDGSTDHTWPSLEERFGSEADCQLVRQPRNGGVAAAIMAGIAHAPTEIVATIDCDCSYDPYDLGAMIPLIEDADIVSASPYHPKGAVLNVPGWRLVLSKTLSKMYGATLGTQLYTWTSCCRVYRKSALDGVQLRNGGFLGVAEILITSVLRGARVVEYPATLESRLFGESKMKIVRTIGGHLGFLAELISARVRRVAGRHPVMGAPRP
jgi:polysaccharide deacetylase family protein (PEP-CTERM system associated)